MRFLRNFKHLPSLSNLECPDDIVQLSVDIILVNPTNILFNLMRSQ